MFLLESLSGAIGIEYLQVALTLAVMGCCSLLWFSKECITTKHLNSNDASGNYSINILHDLQIIFLCAQINVSYAFTGTENYKT